MNILFVGDVVGEVGLAFLEQHLPTLQARHKVDFTVVNGENLAENDDGAGLTQNAVQRLQALGVDAITGGNHSWDGAEGVQVHAAPVVLRPLNRGAAWAGRGALLLEKPSGRLGVINVAGKSAIADIDQPLPFLERQIEQWQPLGLDAVLVDFHGESVFEKISIAYSLAGRVSAVLGTHTHVPTLDCRILEGGVAYCSDVGMTGPSGGAQGYAPQSFVQRFRSQGAIRLPMRLARGEVELGAVLVQVSGGQATAIKRLEF
jgi:metallophosphoesterase (TIGR00282 family)